MWPIGDALVLVKGRLRSSPTNQSRKPFPSCPNPLHQLSGNAFVLATVHPPPERRALQRASTEVEGERDQRIELSVCKGHGDEPQHGSLGDPHILAQELGGISSRDTRCELLLFMRQHHMTVANGRIAGRANVDRRAEALKPLDQVEPRFGDVTHQPPRRILLI